MNVPLPTFRPTAVLTPVCAAVALLAAAAVCFGTHPAWADLDPGHGLDVILWTRRLLWVLAGVSLLASIGVIVIVVAARRSSLWLAVLVPVLALFVQRFAGDTEPFGVADEPAFVDADKADFVKDDDWVVALRFNDHAYAYPLAALFTEPAVVHTDHDRRLVLFWSARANRVTAFEATGDLRGRDLDVVCQPAGSLLVYNANHAQFIVGVTGQTPDRAKPTGLGSAVPTAKTTYAKWKAANPAGKVMRGGRPAAPGVVVPTRPVDSDGVMLADGATTRAASRPSTASTRPVAKRVTIVGTGGPVAVDPAALSGAPAAVKVDDQLALLVKADRSAAVRAFLRKVEDMTPRFEPAADPKLADVRMKDVETGSLWSFNGVAVGGNPVFRGRRLPTLPVDEDVDLGVMKRWVPELEVYQEPPPPAPPRPAVAVREPATKPARRTTKKGTAVAPAATPGRQPVKPSGAAATMR